jgi:hypothetical protein
LGLRCSCGVRSNPTSETPSVSFVFENGGFRSGSLTLTVDVCADSLESSTLSAVFVEHTALVPVANFVFTSTSITRVSCSPNDDGTCIVTIVGEGLVAGELTPRDFDLNLVNRPSPLNDRMTGFTISGFTNQNTLADLSPDLTFFGCPTTP